MTNWKTYKLGDILNFRRGHDLPKTEMVNGEIPVAGSNGVIGYHNVSTPIEPCITIGRSGNVGTPYIYAKCWAHNTVLYVDDFKGNDPLYLYYLLKTIPLASYGGGSAVPTLNRNHIHPIEIKHTPSLAEQRRIAGILGAIDDKIENNRRINDNLEQQAQALYKQWFVDNRSDDWETKKLSEFFNVVTGKKDANFSTKDGSYPFFTCSQDVLKAPDYSFEGAAILLAGNGDFNVKRYIGKFEAYQRTYVLIPFDRKYHSFLYLTIKHYLQEITGGSRGSVIKFITKGNIADFEVALPQINIDDKLAVLDSLYQTIDGNMTENENLATLRDSLLPKLMNGEIKL